MLVSIGYASNILGVCKKALRRRDKAGELVPMRTAGGYRRYSLESLKDFMQTVYMSKYKPRVYRT
ncbi:MAG: MerR family DNA-binding transcriptional regulator [Promethearchaeota archaeon]